MYWLKENWSIFLIFVLYGIVLFLSVISVVIKMRHKDIVEERCTAESGIVFSSKHRHACVRDCKVLWTKNVYKRWK